MESKFELLEDHSKYYLVKDTSTGEEKKLFKIDPEELKRGHSERVKKVAEKLSEIDVSSLISRLEIICKNDISISRYEGLVKALTSQLNRYYDKVGSPNLFHYPIKNIDVNIYGKAQTFHKEVEHLLEIMYEVRAVTRSREGEDV